MRRTEDSSRAGWTGVPLGKGGVGYWQGLAAASLLALAAVPAEARTLAEIRSSGTLRICVAGSSVDLYQANGEAFARFLGVQPEVRKLASFDQQFHNAQGVTVRDREYESQLLADGSCDLFPNDLHVVDWRETKMLIVRYYTVRNGVVAHQDLASKLQGVADLAGLTAAVQKGTNYDDWLLRANAGALADRPVTIVYASTSESMRLVAAHKADFTIVGIEGAFKWVREGPGLVLLFPVDDAVHVGWGVKPGAKQLAKELERFFAESNRAGSVLDQNWRRFYNISFKEYQQFAASFGAGKFDLDTLLAWALPSLGGLAILIAAILLWNRRLNREVLERKAAEEALRKAHAQLAEREAFTRALHESSPSGLALVADSGAIRHISTHWTRMLGYTGDDLPSLTTPRVWADPADRPEFLALLEKDGSVRNFETRFRRKTGEILPVLLNASRVTIGGERLIASWTHDISELKAAEVRLKEALDRQEAIFGASPYGIAVYQQRRCVIASPSFERIFGYAPGEFAGMGARALFGSDDEFEWIGRELYATVVRGETYHYETQCVRKDGTLFWCRVSAALLPGQEAVRGIVALYEDVSARKAAEEALRSANAEQDAIFESATSGIALVRNLRIQHCNRRLEEILGYPKGAAVGLALTELLQVPGEGRAQTEDRARAQLASGETYRREREMTRQDGRRVWCRFSGHAIDPADLAIGTVWIVEDISEEHQAAEALRAANAEQNAIFESATSGIALIKDRVILNCNRKLEEIFGYAPREFIGKPTRVWYASDAEHARGGAEVYAQLARGETHRREQELVRKDGSRFWCRLNGRAIDRADASKGTVWMLEDITEEHVAAEALRTANERLDLAQQASNIGVWDVVIGGRNIWSPQLERMFGLQAGTFPGTVEAWAALIHPEDRERSAKCFSDALADPATNFYSDEFRVMRPSGEIRWFQTIGRIYRGPDGTALRSVGVNVDMTELIAARRTAEEATKAKSMFLATMSHEIRTPMNGVLGLLQLLGFGKLDPEQKATLDGARESARSLLRIIDDLLDFSKIEAGKLEIRPETASVAAIVESVRQVYSGVASGKDLNFGTSVDARISPALKVDPLRLRQILNNFVSNAIKFTHKGGVEIKAVLVERKEGRDVVRFSVADSGIGVSKEAQARLFQAYAQASADTARHFGGTGLGLTICRRLAEMMHGEISMQSEPGKGTTMTLTLSLPVGETKDLPRADPTGAAAAAMVASRRRAPTIEEARREGTLILVAEDHPTNRSVLVRLLGLLGYAAETAENGKLALEKWQGGGFALLLTDCNMPEMDGYELAQAVRSRETGGKRAPIIACTANALAGEADRCLAAGMDDFVAKPVELEALARAVERWLPIAGAAQGPAIKAATGAGGNGAPLDRASLAQISGGDGAAEREILAEFRAANDADMVALRAALIARDIEQVTKASHRVKGACKMVGALALALVCERMEKAGRQKVWGDIAAEQAALEREFERLNRWLEAN